MPSNRGRGTLTACQPSRSIKTRPSRRGECCPSRVSCDTRNDFDREMRASEHKLQPPDLIGGGDKLAVYIRNLHPFGDVTLLDRVTQKARGNFKT